MSETKPSYQWNADEYVRHSSAQMKWAEELIAKLHLRGGEAVLDIGCGDGRISAAIAQRVPAGRVLGIDNSAEMIERAEALRVSSGPANIAFRLMDACEMDFRSQFDVAFSNASLHWIHDHVRLLRRVHAALRPGGRILFQMGGRGNAADVADVMADVCARKRWRGHFEGFAFPYFFPGEDEYRALLEGAGFAVRRVELTPKDMVQRGAEGFAGWVRTTWMPYTQRVPEGLREELVSELVAEYVQRHKPDSSGDVHVRMVRLEVEAARGTEAGSPGTAHAPADGRP